MRFEELEVWLGIPTRGQSSPSILQKSKPIIKTFRFSDVSNDDKAVLILRRVTDILSNIHKRQIGNKSVVDIYFSIAES
jgi:hypothetical protein